MAGSGITILGQLFLESRKDGKENRKFQTQKYEELFTLVFEKMRELRNPVDLRSRMDAGQVEESNSGRMLAIANAYFVNAIGLVIDDFERCATDYEDAIRNVTSRDDLTNEFLDSKFRSYMDAKQNALQALTAHGRKQVGLDFKY